MTFATTAVGFVDYFELLQVSPNAETPTIHRIYKLLAARYHPDNVATGDKERFLVLQEAYRVLSDPELRAAYKAEWEVHRLRPKAVFEMPEFFRGIEAESYRRIGILCLLYNQRRNTLDHPGVSLFELESMMAIPREHLEFTTWYLKDKNYVIIHDSGNLVITAEGVDFVEANAPSNQVISKLLKAGDEAQT